MRTNVAARSSPSDAGGRRRTSNPKSSGAKGRADVHRALVVEKHPARSLVMEEVTILKRGELIDPFSADLSSVSSDDVVFSSTNWLGPEPEVLPKSIGLRSIEPVPKAEFAGVGFISSPAPSSVPFPTSFFPKHAILLPEG